MQLVNYWSDFDTISPIIVGSIHWLKLGLFDLDSQQCTGSWSPRTEFN